MSAHNIPFFNMKTKHTLDYPKSPAMGFFAFEPLTFYCMQDRMMAKCLTFHFHANSEFRNF